jgi:hypothetical protein
MNFPKESGKSVYGMFTCITIRIPQGTIRGFRHNLDARWKGLSSRLPHHVDGGHSFLQGVNLKYFLIDWVAVPSPLHKYVVVPIELQWNHTRNWNVSLEVRHLYSPCLSAVCFQSSFRGIIPLLKQGPVLIEVIPTAKQVL